MPRRRERFGDRVARQPGKENAPVLHRLMRYSSMQITMDCHTNLDDALHASVRLPDLPEESQRGAEEKQRHHAFRSRGNPS